LISIVRLIGRRRYAVSAVAVGTHREERTVARDVVVEYSPQESGFTDVHERMTRTVTARRLAALKGFDYAGDFDPVTRYQGRVYFVPSDTLVDVKQAAELGIKDEHDLFGGVVPYSFTGTKAIT